MGPDTYDLVSLLRDSSVDIGTPSSRADEVLPVAWGGPTPAGSATGSISWPFGAISKRSARSAQAGARGPVCIQYASHARVRAPTLPVTPIRPPRELLAAHIPELA
jgi:hypothetical protein